MHRSFLEEWIFLVVGKILVLLVAFFFLNFNSKSIENLMFLAFGKILVLRLLVPKSISDAWVLV